MKAVFQRAAPYAKDALDLPVKEVESAIPYYERVFGFNVVSREVSPRAKVTLARDDVQIGLSENGRDPTQEGCFFEVNDVEAAQSEIKDASGGPCVIDMQTINGKSYRAFFVVAPDGLCYMVAQRAD